MGKLTALSFLVVLLAARFGFAEAQKAAPLAPVSAPSSNPAPAPNCPISDFKYLSTDEKGNWLFEFSGKIRQATMKENGEWEVSYHGDRKTTMLEDDGAALSRIAAEEIRKAYLEGKDPDAKLVTVFHLSAERHLKYFNESLLDEMKKSLDLLEEEGQKMAPEDKKKFIEEIGKKSLIENANKALELSKKSSTLRDGIALWLTVMMTADAVGVPSYYTPGDGAEEFSTADLFPSFNLSEKPEPCTLKQSARLEGLEQLYKDLKSRNYGSSAAAKAPVAK